MEFYVLPNSQLAFGSFYSPMYTIKNNGSKNISVSLDSFQIKDKIEDDDTTPLYVEKLNSQDNKTQIELKLCAIDDLSTKNISKHIDLTFIDEIVSIVEYSHKDSISMNTDRNNYVVEEMQKRNMEKELSLYNIEEYEVDNVNIISNKSIQDKIIKNDISNWKSKLKC